MRVIIQRSAQASVEVAGNIIGSIEKGLLVLVGMEEKDTEEDLEWLCKKIVSLRIFSDEHGKMNLSINEVSGDILLVSQFTLHASTKKGNRPSFAYSANAEKAKDLYQKMILKLSESLGKNIATGEFGADMKVHLINDGPVTIFIDTKNKE